MEILTASSFTPNKLLSWFHLEDANWAVTLDGLASTIVDRFVRLIMIMFVVRSAGNGSISEYGVKFIGQEGELVLEVNRSLKDDNESVWLKLGCIKV
jgi:hypothetical protein